MAEKKKPWKYMTVRDDAADACFKGGKIPGIKIPE